MVGVVADEDDDGNAASQRGSYEPPARPAPKAEDKTAAAKSYVDEAIKAIGTLTDATGLNATSSGALRISASAAFQGQNATVAIAQTNVMTAAQAAQATAAASASGSSGAMWWRRPPPTR
jgi:hypothetical protein